MADFVLPYTTMGKPEKYKYAPAQSKPSMYSEGSEAGLGNRGYWIEFHYEHLFFFFFSPVSD